MKANTMVTRKRLLAPVMGLALLALVSSGCATLAGAAIGAGSGAAIGAGVDDKDRARGAKKGALIGAGAGAVGGTLYGIAR